MYASFLIFFFDFVEFFFSDKNRTVQKLVVFMYPIYGQTRCFFLDNVSKRFLVRERLVNSIIKSN